MSDAEVKTSGRRIKKVGNTTVIIHPGTAKTPEEIEKVNKDLEKALRKAWSNNQKKE